MPLLGAWRECNRALLKERNEATSEIKKLSSGESERRRELPLVFSSFFFFSLLQKFTMPRPSSPLLQRLLLLAARRASGLSASTSSSSSTSCCCSSSSSYRGYAAGAASLLQLRRGFRQRHQQPRSDRSAVVVASFLSLSLHKSLFFRFLPLERESWSRRRRCQGCGGQGDVSDVEFGGDEVD